MKQSLKHTPGPWMIAEPEFGSNKTYVVTCEHEDEPTLQVLVQDCSLEQSRKMSNARLIAAAPEMLEALERLMDHLQSEKIISTKRVELNALAWQIYGLISRVRGE